MSKKMIGRRKSGPQPGAPMSPHEITRPTLCPTGLGAGQRPLVSAIPRLEAFGPHQSRQLDYPSRF